MNIHINDDWRGEHLIRAPKAPEIIPEPKPEPKFTPRPTGGNCRYKGCDRKLSDKNTTGLCVDHIHMKGVCDCATCRTRKEPKICAAPGCQIQLYKQNQSGVCQAHVHFEGACRCKHCLAQGENEMTLPYQSATSGKNAMNEVQKILQKFGASSFGYMEDFNTGVLTVQFQWKERRVTIEANAKGYAAAMLRETPYTNRMRGTKANYEQKAVKQGQIAVYSILRDWIKGQVTAVEVGMLSFEGAFLGQIMLPSGKTVLQIVEDDGVLTLPKE